MRVSPVQVWRRHSNGTLQRPVLIREDALADHERQQGVECRCIHHIVQFYLINHRMGVNFIPWPKTNTGNVALPIQ